MPTAAFTTLGCKVNQYETQRILESFEDAGFAVVPFDQPADVYVVNTCSVTGVAESKSRSTVRRARRNNPEAKVVVTGCAAQMAINHGRVYPEADLVVPNPLKLETRDRLLAVDPSLARRVEAEPAPDSHRRPQGRTRATLKLQDGCDVMCSYCSIPFTRPGLRSRPAEEVLEEATRMADSGVREAVLTGVLIGAYGPETGSGGPGFEEVVTRLATECGLARVRISSIEMHQVTEPILDLIEAGHIAPHLHIPLQAGDDAVLRDMNRRYDQAAYLALVDRIYDRFPDLSLTTDVLVGFPTETEEHFLSSVSVFERAQYLSAHVFRFSPRPGTPADAFGDPVPPQEKQRRSKTLTETAKRTGERRLARWVGRTVRVLVEGKSRRSELMEGHSDAFLTVRFAGSPSLSNTMRWVRIDEARDGIAYGELVPGPNPLRVL